MSAGKMATIFASLLRRSPKLRACVFGVPVLKMATMAPSTHAAADISPEDVFEAPSAAPNDIPNADALSKRLRGAIEGSEESDDQTVQLRRVSLISDIAYVAGGHPKQKLDIYTPQEIPGSTSLPVVIHVHGGGWVRGDKGRRFYGSPDMAAGYARRGIIAVAPSYRLGHSPDHVEDVAEAVRWVVRNIERYGGNPNQIYLSGHSAGPGPSPSLTPIPNPNLDLDPNPGPHL